MGGNPLGLISIWLDMGLKEEAGVSPRETDPFPGMDSGFAYWKPSIQSKGGGGGGRYLLVSCCVP